MNTNRSLSKLEKSLEVESERVESALCFPGIFSKRRRGNGDERDACGYSGCGCIDFQPDKEGRCLKCNHMIAHMSSRMACNACDCASYRKMKNTPFPQVNKRNKNKCKCGHVFDEHL